MDYNVYGDVCKDGTSQHCNNLTVELANKNVKIKTIMKCYEIRIACHSPRCSRVFRDLIEVPTFLIPRSELPQLPPSVIEAMRFHFDVA